MTTSARKSQVGRFLLTLLLGPLGLVYASSAASSASGPSNEDIDKLMTYAVILGRAIGCGIDTVEEMRLVGRWMDKKFPPGSEYQRVHLPVFVERVKMHADRQRAGDSPDTCSEIRRIHVRMPWPDKGHLAESTGDLHIPDSDANADESTEGIVDQELEVLPNK